MSEVESSSGDESVVEKKHGYEWYKSIESPRYILAPMVNGSELPFRILCKNHNAQLVYTPMLNAHSFAKSEVCRRRGFMTDDRDSPLMVQFSGNDPDLVHKAVKLVLEMEDDLVRRKVIVKRNIVGISLNLGCPKRRAKNEHYGSYLMDSPELICRIIKKVASDESIRVPISCKIRIFPVLEDTLRYVRMLVDEGGITMLVVHGRTKEQMGRGHCNLEVIQKIREEVPNIPVILNGISNVVKCKSDIERILVESSGGCDGVMVSNGCLNNPAIFDEEDGEEEVRNRKKFEVCYEYIDIIRGLEKKFNNNSEEEESEGEIEQQQQQPYYKKAGVKNHIFRFFRAEFAKNPVLREMFGGKVVVEIDEMKMLVEELHFRQENNIQGKDFVAEEEERNNSMIVFSDSFSEEMKKKYFEKLELIVQRKKMKKKRKKEELF